MTIHKLTTKHKDVVLHPLSYRYTTPAEHTNISIAFAIEKLYEAVGTKDDAYLHTLAINDTVASNIEMMILELKKALL